MKIALLVSLLISLTITCHSPAASPPGFREVALPGKVVDVQFAARANIVLLRIDAPAEIAVFDVQTERVLGTIPLLGAGCAYSGTINSAIVISPDKKTIDRWSLAPLAKTLTQPMPFNEAIVAMASGHSSSAPAFVLTREARRFLDVTTLKLVEVQYSPPPDQSGHWGYSIKKLAMAASGDGHTFSGFAFEGADAMQYLRLDGLQATTKSWADYHHIVGYQVPSSDGSWIFTQGGIYNPDLKRVDRENELGFVTAPSAHPGYYIGISPSIWGYESPAYIRLYDLNDRKPRIDFGNLGLKNRMLEHRGNVSLSQKYIVNPDLKKMMMIADSNDRILVRDFDLKAELDKSGKEYLIVESIPPRTISPGAAYQYDIKTLSKSGGVTCNLEFGPQGMTVSKEGAMRWTVPQKISRKPIQVIVTVQDASGLSTVHAFELTAP